MKTIFVLKDRLLPNRKLEVVEKTLTVLRWGSGSDTGTRREGRLIYIRTSMHGM